MPAPQPTTHTDFNHQDTHILTNNFHTGEPTIHTCNYALAVEAFSDYLDDTKFSVNQVRFVNLIVDELTANGVMEPDRLFESPYTDHAPTGPDFVFPDPDVAVIVDTLRDIKQHAFPAAAA